MYFSLYIILIIFIQTSATKNSNKKFIYIKKSYKLVFKEIGKTRLRFSVIFVNVVVRPFKLI